MGKHLKEFLKKKLQVMKNATYMRWRLFASLSFIFFFSMGNIFGQEEGAIFLTNPSFEDLPQHSKPPRGWYDCGFPGESPVDVQPSGQFGVIKPPIEGQSYLGMVVRDNDTWEAVSQRLSTPLKKGQCYSFSIHLARSNLYISYSRLPGKDNKEANYITPAKLRIYGGFDYCDKKYMMAETNLVINERWIEYNFKFEPIEDYTHIIFEAFYKTPTLFPYNGNIILDNASAIKPIPCDEELLEEEAEEPEEVTTAPEPPTPPVAEKKTPEKTDPFEPNQPKAPEKATTPTPQPEEVADDPIKFSKEIKRSDLKKGQKLQVDNLYFEADKSVIRDQSYQILNEIFDFLNINKDLVVEIGGHTNGLPPDWYCDQLSNDRAEAVVKYLVEKGISRNRLQFKGYGKRQPVATNETEEGRAKNQRVEIKILDISG
jgi:outer membrane protein OmpA-like peptidoglycan-associated protein